MRWLGLALMLLAVPVVASSAADAAAQRERIAREQAAVERDARAAQAACASQFAVTACVDGVRAERRRRLQALDRERAVLDEVAHVGEVRGLVVQPLEPVGGDRAERHGNQARQPQQKPDPQSYHEDGGRGAGAHAGRLYIGTHPRCRDADAL